MSVKSAAARAFGLLAPRIVRPRARRVLFASIPDFSDSAFAMYRHLITSREDLEIVWLVRESAAAAQVEDHFSRVNTGERNSLIVRRWHDPASYLSYLRSSTVFHTHGVYNFSALVDTRTVVSLWHGMPLKVIGALDPSPGWRGDVHGDVHVATSRFFRYVVSAAFEVSPRLVVASGLPRCDVLKGLASADHDPQAVRAGLGVNPADQLLLWLPTHRVDGWSSSEESSFLDDVDAGLLDALLRECQAQRCRLVVKLHPYDRLNAAPPRWLSEHEAVTLITAKAWARTGIQLYDLVAASDGLITDVSSVLLDYLHTRRPIGIVGFDEQSYGRDLVVPRAVLVESAAITVVQSEGLARAFVKSVVDGIDVEVPTGDVAHLMNEDGEMFSSEVLAQHAGL